MPDTARILPEAYERARDEYAEAIGRRREELITPALVLDIDAAQRRVEAGGGQILNGPLELPDGTWIIRCVDPQGAIFALEGKRRRQSVGYFERVSSGGVVTNDRRWSW